MLIDEAVILVSNLPYLYSEDLDRMKMWDRIGNGLDSCSSKASDWQQFINDILDYIKADFSRVAANSKIALFIENMEHKPESWKKSFITTIQKKKFFIIIKARSVYNLNKVSK